MVATADRTQQMPSTYGYYRQPDGWVTVSLATDLEETVFRRKGWEPLKQYGKVEMAGAYAVNHPLEALFQGGGAKELPVDQVIGMGLHLSKPLLPACGLRLNQYHKQHTNGANDTIDCWTGAEPVEFPQLENPPPAVPCTICKREFPTDEACGQHEEVMHKEHKADIRMGEALASALNGKQQGAFAHPYICGLCSAGFDNLTSFTNHVQEEQANGQERQTEGTGHTASPRPGGA